jgi:hypothetical protein
VCTAGLFARADCQNTNGRVYPKSILQREVARFKQQHVQKGTALGELNHPSYFSSYFRHLNLPNVSHQVLDLRWRGPELWGTLEVLPTPAGLLLSELYSKVRQQHNPSNIQAAALHPLVSAACTGQVMLAAALAVLSSVCTTHAVSTQGHHCAC